MSTSPPSKRSRKPRVTASDDFWRTPTLDELAAEQGIKPIERIDTLIGKGADLWESDEEFALFQSWLRRTRGYR